MSVIRSGMRVRCIKAGWESSGPAVGDVCLVLKARLWDGRGRHIEAFYLRLAQWHGRVYLAEHFVPLDQIDELKEMIRTVKQPVDA